MSDSIKCQAVRLGRTWVVHVPEHEVYGYGRTLEAARENTEGGLALIGVTAKVTITAMTPELEHLRVAEAAYEAALSEAVAALLLRRATLGDIARATGVPASRVKRILAGRSAPGAAPSPVTAPPPVPAALMPSG